MKQIVYISCPLSKQIYSFKLNLNGKLKLLQIIDTPGYGQPMVINPNNKYLYLGVYPEYKIINYKIDKHGYLNESISIHLPGKPTQLTTDLSGKMLYCASYANSCLSVHSINYKGVVNNYIQNINNLKNCHSANIDINRNILWVPCLTKNYIKLYSINKLNGLLTPYNPDKLIFGNKQGPRHMVFHNNSNYAYVINECNGTINVIKLKNYTIIQNISLMPINCTRSSWSADIHLTPNNKWLYCSDRLTNMISKFAVSIDGSKLTLLGHQITEHQPRGFNIDKTGNFLIVAGQKSNYIKIHKIYNNNGSIIPISRYQVGRGPVWVSIIRIK